MSDIVFHKQRFRHDPANGVWGDCYRTALAYLVGAIPEAVPHFYEGGRSGPEGDILINAFLAEHGLGKITFAYEGTIEDLPGLMHVIGTQNNSGVYYLLSGSSKNGCNHVVICRQGKIVWDTSLDDSGIVGPGDAGQFQFEFLTVAGGAPALRRAA
jgi:hypothetical protein